MKSMTRPWTPLFPFISLVISVQVFHVVPVHAERYFAIDSSGRRIVHDSDDPNSRYHIIPADETQVKQGGVTFLLTFEDVTLDTGIGFDDPFFGGSRRAVMNRIFDYLSSVLDHSGAASVFIERSIDDPSSGLLAAAGPFFNSSPGFTNGFPFTRITTGNDPSGPGNPEMLVFVNFGHDWFTGEGTPPQDQFDLFTVLLHEITHGLGILSFSDNRGLNEFAPNVYSIWDRFMAREATGNLLFQLVGGLPTFVGSTGDLVSDNLVFTGPNAFDAFGSAPGVYAPLPFEEGSSLAHFALNTPDDVVMQPFLGSGETKREFALLELGALEDIGYAIITALDCLTDVSVVAPLNGAQIDIPAGANAASLAFVAEPNCLDATDEVTFTLNNAVAGSLSSPPFRLGVTLPPGQYDLVVTASNSALEVERQISFEVVAAPNADSDNNGLADDPFAVLSNAGDQWNDTAAGTGRLVGLARFESTVVDGLSGDNAVVTVADPSRLTRLISVAVPRAVLAPDESGVLLVSAGPDLDTVLGAAEASMVAEAPPGTLIERGAFVDVSVLTTSDNGATFDELDNELLVGLPVVLSFVDVDLAQVQLGVFSYPTFAASDPNSGLALLAEDGEWASSNVSIFSASGGAVEAQLFSLSVFAPLNSPPLIEALPADLAFGNVAVNGSLTLPVTIKNRGGGNLLGVPTTAAPFTAPAGTFYDLESGESVSIPVTFAPNAEGTFSSQILFSGGGGASVFATGTGGNEAGISVVPFLLDFEAITVGETATMNFAITNDTDEMQTGSIVVGAPFTATPDTFALAAGASGLVEIEFTPVIAGAVSDIVSFTSDTDIMVSRSVSGVGSLPPVLAVSPQTLDFGVVDVKSTSTRVFFVQNVGGGVLSGEAAVEPPFEIVDGGEYTLLEGQVANVTVAFKPDQKGEATQIATFTGGAGLNRTVRGQGVIPPILSVTPGVHDFGGVPVDTTAEFVFTVENAGEGTLVGRANVSGFFEIVGERNYALGPGETQDVTVAFAPLNVQAFFGELRLTGGAGANVNLQGTGIEGAAVACGGPRKGRSSADLMVVAAMAGWLCLRSRRRIDRQIP